MDMIQLMAEGTMKAAAILLSRAEYACCRNARTEICESLRAEIEKAFPQWEEEWEEALEANLGEKWYHLLCNVQCVDAARAALDDARNSFFKGVVL